MVKDRLRSMWRYRYQERMRGQRFDQVFDEKVVLQLKIRSCASGAGGHLRDRSQDLGGRPEGHYCFACRSFLVSIPEVYE